MIENDKAVENTTNVLYLTDETLNYFPAYFSRVIFYKPKFWNIDDEIVGKESDGSDKFRKITMVVFSESVLITDEKTYIGDFNVILYRGGDIDIKYRNELSNAVDLKIRRAKL